MPRSSCEVVVVGGGVIGCAIALRLADDGWRVLVLERARPGAGASSAAAGMIAPQAEATGVTPLLDLGLLSRSRYEEWVAEIVDRGGEDTGYRRTGLVVVALDAKELSRLEERRRWQQSRGLRVESIDREAIASRAGGLGDEITGGLFLPDESLVNPVRLMAALAAAAGRSGVRFRAGTAADAILQRSGRAVGVRVGSETVRADLVVIAAGCWSAQFAADVPDLPAIRPERGQIVELGPSGVVPACILYSRIGYVAPRDRHVVVGSTSEDAGFDARPTASGVSGLLLTAARLRPDLMTARFVGAWGGLRPVGADRLPTLGMSRLDGCVIATGHHRNGILLAPVTADIVGALVAGRQPGLDLTPFAPGRDMLGVSAPAANAT
ncbi:MAG: glycine oxidase ThiO [Acidobacteriota bacterium]